MAYDRDHAPVNVNDSPRRSICVLGAGFAGLAAAEALLDAGMQVSVLEARNRVGGRVWSQQLSNGAIVERGAEFIERGQEAILAAVERLGLRIQPAGTSYSYREPRGGLGATPEALNEAAVAVNRALAEGAADRGGLSVAAFLEGVPMDEGARQVLLSRVQVSSAHPVEDVSVEALGHMTFLPDEGLRIAGGNQQVALRLAERLGDSLFLSRPVEVVLWSADGVRVRSGGDSVEADRCVLAVPASVMHRIHFEPALPDWKVGALRRVVYGHAAKLFVPLSEVPPPSSVLSVPEHFWTWTARGADGEVQPVMSAFAGSRPALEALHITDGPERWLDRVRALRPDLALICEEAVLSTWSDDPWAGAAYSVVTPGTPAEDEALLARPVGPLHFAEEHTAGRYHSSMNGGLRSGIRAAEEITGDP